MSLSVTFRPLEIFLDQRTILLTSFKPQYLDLGPRYCHGVWKCLDRKVHPFHLRDPSIISKIYIWGDHTGFYDLTPKSIGNCNGYENSNDGTRSGPVIYSFIKYGMGLTNYNDTQERASLC